RLHAGVLKTKIESHMNILLLMLFSVFLGVAVNAQTKKISGTVLDDADKPLAGVTVTLQNSQLITQTDQNGTFTINIPATGTSSLVFTYTGFAPQTRPEERR